VERVCDAKETLTDKNGKFELPAASCAGSPFAKLHNPWVVIFKAGYPGYPPLGASPAERKAHVPGLTGREFVHESQYCTIRLGRPKTRREKEFTLSDAASLFHNNDSFKKLPILLSLINEEERSLGLKPIGPSK
jgi:hypothetical protein